MNTGYNNKAAKLQLRLNLVNVVLLYIEAHNSNRIIKLQNVVLKKKRQVFPGQ